MFANDFVFKKNDINVSHTWLYIVSNKEQTNHCCFVIKRSYIFYWDYIVQADRAPEICWDELKNTRWSFLQLIPFIWIRHTRSVIHLSVFLNLYISVTIRSWDTSRENSKILSATLLPDFKYRYVVCDNLDRKLDHYKSLIFHIIWEQSRAQSRASTGLIGLLCTFHLVTMVVSLWAIFFWKFSTLQRSKIWEYSIKPKNTFKTMVLQV